MRPARLLCTLALGAGVLSGCGSNDGVIDRADAEALQSELDRVAEAIAAGDCNAADTAVIAVRTQLRALREKIPDNLAHSFTVGFTALQEHAGPDCKAVQEAKQQETTTTTETTPTTTTTPEETPTPEPTSTATPEPTATPTPTPTTDTTATDPTGGAPPEDQG